MEFKPLSYLPGYEISREGQVRNIKTGHVLKHYMRNGTKKTSFVDIWINPLSRRSSQIGALLYEAYGPGAAAKAGFKEPNPAKLRASRSERREHIPKVSSLFKRRCTTCGKPTTNYRCDDCWHKMRGYDRDGANERDSPFGIYL